MDKQPGAAKQADATVREMGETGCDESEHVGSPQESLKDRLWLWELFAWLLCASGLIAIAIILSVTEGKPIPTWKAQATKSGPSFTVTINSVISIFSTLVKSTLLIPVVASLHQLKWLWFREERPLTDVTLFESAGKGPLGSVMLIWAMRGRALACIGALVVIASLGIDFTLQQLVTYPFRPTAQTTSAHVPQSNVYAAFRPGVSETTPDPETAMVAALYRGIYNFNESQFLPTPDCVSGNCTWAEPYTSIGICSQCSDVTHLLNISCSTWDYVVPDLDENDVAIRNTTVGGPIPYCNYTLPGEQALVGGEHAVPVVMQINGTWASGYFNNGLNAHLKVFTVIRATVNHVFEDFGPFQTRGWDNVTNVNATECGFDFCVKNYRGQVEKGVFSESVIDTFINTTDLARGGYDDQGAAKGIIIEPPSEWMGHNNTNGANVFSLDPEVTLALRSMIGGGSDTEIFRGISESTGEPGKDLANTDMAAFLSPLSNEELFAMAQSIAASMTKRMREAPGAQASGIVNQDLPYVNVRWGWISFPAALVMLSLAFLILTILANKKGGAMLWKSNSLANFYHPLTKDGRDELQAGHTAVEAEAIAERMRVKWAKTEAGVRLVQRHET